MLRSNLAPCAGAGRGNRTPATSLEGWGSTTELHPRIFPRHTHESGWWRELDSNQRRRAPTGLQPVPFSHSGTPPDDIEKLQFMVGRTMGICRRMSTSKRRTNLPTAVIFSPAAQVSILRENDYMTDSGHAQVIINTERSFETSQIGTQFARRSQNERWSESVALRSSCGVRRAEKPGPRMPRPFDYP